MLAPLLAELYDRDWLLLTDLLSTSTPWLCGALGVNTPMVNASALDVRGTKGDLILAICAAVGASSYLSGPFGRDYLDAERFADAGISIAYHDFVHPVYSQGNAPFIPYLSIVDLLSHHGPDSLRILTGGADTNAPGA